MTSEWRTIRAADFIDFNPRLSLKKGDIATKVAMDKLKPFTKKIPETEKAEFNGGAKFCNGDTVMARITPCLENGKTAYVDMLDDGEIGFGSTEFIRAYFEQTMSDPHGRYLSWEHCYKAFLENRDANDEQAIDHLALHLAFYLASWGMYRGSSFLLQKDYKVHIPVVKIIQEKNMIR